MSETMPSIATVPIIEAIQVSYVNSRGTEVSQQRFYEVVPMALDGQAEPVYKKRQLKNTVAREIFVEAVGSLLSPDYGQESISDAAVTEVPEEVTSDDSSKPNTGASSIFDFEGKDKLEDEFDDGNSNSNTSAVSTNVYPISRKPSKNKLSRITRGGLAVLVGGIALVAAACSGSGRTELPKPTAAVAAASAPQGGESTDSTVANESNEDESDAEAGQEDLEFRMESASNKAIAEVGLPASVIEEIEDYDKILEGPREAGDSSLNRNKWEGYPMTLNGGGQMGADILAGTGNFDAVDSQIGRQALKEKNVHAQIMDQLAENDFTGIIAKGYIINAPHAIYERIAYQNKDKDGNRVLGYDNKRRVGEKDVFVVITYQDPETKEIKSFKARFDCSGFIQTFDKVTAPVPVKAPTPAPTPNQPNETPKTTTTVPNKGSTTSSTVPGTTSSTIPGTTSSTVPGTTSTTVPGSTTTSTPNIITTTTTMPEITTTTSTPNSTTTAPPVTAPPETKPPVTAPDKKPQEPVTTSSTIKTPDLPPPPPTPPTAPPTTETPATLPPPPPTPPSTAPPSTAPDKVPGNPTPNVSVPVKNVEAPVASPSAPTTRLVAPAPAPTPAPTLAPSPPSTARPTPSSNPNRPVTTQAPIQAPIPAPVVAPEGPSGRNPIDLPKRESPSTTVGAFGMIGLANVIRRKFVRK